MKLIIRKVDEDTKHKDEEIDTVRMIELRVIIAGDIFHISQQGLDLVVRSSTGRLISRPRSANIILVGIE
jgi:hypothetical protein